MIYTEAAEIVGNRYGRRLLWLVSDANPDAAQRFAYRRLLIQLAGGTPAAGWTPPLGGGCGGCR